MSTYCVTFRIANKLAKGRTYDQRREALVDAVRQQNGGYWDETTSFFLVESNLDTWNFADQAAEPLSANDDMLVVFDPSDMSCAWFGQLRDEDILGSFFRTFQKVD